MAVIVGGAGHTWVAPEKLNAVGKTNKRSDNGFLHLGALEGPIDAHNAVGLVVRIVERFLKQDPCLPWEGACGEYAGAML